MIPTVSILIPNFNKAPFLRETLNSVLSQTYTNWECIIVDDHSTDNSWEILEEYTQIDRRIKIYRRPENQKRGGNAARNYAFLKSSGSFVNWFDSDDIMDQYMIEKKLEIFLKDKRLDIVLGELVRDEVKFLSMNKLHFFSTSLDLMPSYYLLGKTWFQTSQPMFKREFLINSERYFDEDLVKGQEAEYFVYLLTLKPKICYAFDSIIFWKTIPSSISYSDSIQPYSIKLIKEFPFKYKSIKMLFHSNLFNSDVDNYFKKIFLEIISYCGLFNRVFFMNIYLGFILFSSRNSNFYYTSFKILLNRIFNLTIFRNI